jgi:hypothetical protein
MLQFPKLAAELAKLGKSDRERAMALHLTERQFFKWKNGLLPKSVLRLTPAALRALADDLESATNKAA